MSKRRHATTLAAVFDKTANIPWLDVKAMLLQLGAVVSGRGGSIVWIVLKGRRMVLHAPHGGRADLECGRVKSLRGFLIQAGIKEEYFYEVQRV